MKQILILLTSLALLTACRLLPPAQPPLPTIVPVASTTPRQVDPTNTLTPVPTATTSPTLPPETPTNPAEPPPGETATIPPADSPTSSPTITANLPPLDSLTIHVKAIASGFEHPVYLTHAGDGSGRLFVVEQPGRIRIIKNGQVLPTPFLDIVSIVGSSATEQGLLSVAFHPDYANNGFFFVDYTNVNGNTVIARYHVSANPDVADPTSAKILLTIDQPYPNHNGGQLVFGPDGYLYVGMGDGGSANDPHNNGQSLDTLLGKILRLDVNQGDPYGVPADNPFVGQANARPEIWAYGLRNPWRFSFDRATNDMYIADVGQNKYEEVDFAAAGTPGGQNYGWRLMEGLHCFNPAQCDPASLNVVLPVAEYDHSQGCSITGGYVYRGTQFPALTGVYFYADYCSGQLWGLRREANGSWSQAKLAQLDANISSFGQDAAGEVYVIDHRGKVFQIVQ